MNKTEHIFLQLSHKKFNQENLEKIKTYRAEKGYPVKLINKLITKETQSDIVNTNKIASTNKMHLKMPCVSNLSEKLVG